MLLLTSTSMSRSCCGARGLAVARLDEGRRPLSAFAAAVRRPSTPSVSMPALAPLSRAPQTYVLYLLPELTSLDTLVLAPETKVAAQSTFAKKRMYYNMRIKSMARQVAAAAHAAREGCQVRVASPAARSGCDAAIADWLYCVQPGDDVRRRDQGQCCGCWCL